MGGRGVLAACAAILPALNFEEPAMGPPRRRGGFSSGIGPELLARLPAQEGVAEEADLLLVGDATLFERGVRVAGGL